MPGRALSDTKKKQIDSQFQEKWVQIAADRYNEAEVERHGASGTKRKSLQRVCEQVQAECYEKTKKYVCLSTSTVSDRANGKQSIQGFNKEKRWLQADEEEIMVDFTIDCALRGFPLNHDRLKEHVDAICRARGVKDFPGDGVGQEWTYRFVERHSERLKPYWSRSLDTSRARAVNPYTHEEYFDLLEKTIKGSNGEEEIAPECIYGMDETGIQEGIGLQERVLGPVGQKVQYQQRSGERENITVIATICADGTSIPPAVIFKAQAFQVKWKQNNPLKASLGHSPKGYTDGEIGVEWIKQFDKHTKEKAAGRRRLLLVDGHVSHYTFAFLNYARKSNIHVLCYPSHSTHIYQGLDVVIFGPLKRAWSKARDNYERTKGLVDKTNFLEVYATAHLEAFSPENIKAAFRKTGVVPLNRNAIPITAMAPSIELSIRGTLPFPLQSSPVRAVSKLIQDAAAAHRSASASSSTCTLPETPRTPTRLRTTFNVLTSTSAAYLLSPTPLPLHAAPPKYLTVPISPIKPYHADLLARKPSTQLEHELQEALRDSDSRYRALKKTVTNIQAAAVLQGVYLNRVQERMQSQGEKEGRPKKKGKLMGDGRPRLLDDDVFVAQVAEHENAQKKKEQGKKERKAEKGRHAKALEEWKAACKARDERVKTQREQYREALERWEKERVSARTEHRRIGLEKPVLGKLEKQRERPKKRKAGEMDSDEGSDLEGDDADVYDN